MILPDMSSQIAVGALTFWMVIFAVKHVIADFVLQTSWMATGKDAKTGWALPLLVHCAIHGALATAILLMLAPRFWFLGLVDFVVHLDHRSRQGFLRLHLQCHDGASVVLVADRHRSGVASPDRFRPCRGAGGQLKQAFVQCGRSFGGGHGL